MFRNTGSFADEMSTHSGSQPGAPGQLPRQLERIVVYVDGRALSRESIGRWLAAHLLGFAVQVEATDAEAIAFAGANEQTVLVLKHLGPANATSPAINDVLSEFVARLSGIHVAVFADSEQVDAVTAALQCGVRGYIPTNLQAAVVVEAVRLICAGDVYAPVASLLRQPLADPGGTGVAEALPTDIGFSQRQLEILACLRQGMANKHIAHALGLSEATVKVHVRNIMKKLRVTNRTQVVLKTSTLYSSLT